MMLKRLILLLLITTLAGCGPVKSPPVARYVLSGVTTNDVSHFPRTRYTLLVSRPVASAGYQTSEMMYVNQPYRLSQFARHGWVSPPADMLAPLLASAIENTHYFYAVASSSYVGTTNFRLDTELLSLRQVFEKGGSAVIVTIQASLTNARQNSLLKSQRFSARVPVLYPTPYGGVVAANEAVNQLLKQIALFTIDSANNRQLPKPNLMGR